MNFPFARTSSPIHGRSTVRGKTLSVHSSVDVRINTEFNRTPLNLSWLVWLVAFEHTRHLVLYVKYISWHSARQNKCNNEKIAEHAVASKRYAVNQGIQFRTGKRIRRFRRLTLWELWRATATTVRDCMKKQTPNSEIALSGCILNGNLQLENTYVLWISSIRNLPYCCCLIPKSYGITVPQIRIGHFRYCLV